MTDTILDPHADGMAPPSIFVPADFPLARVTQAELDAVLAAQGGDDAVDDLYPLTPLQQGMLFHAQESPRSGLYVEQLGVTLRGLDAEAYGRAWQQVIDRHTVLRTAFVSGITAEPLQVVHREARLAVETLDWRALAPEGRRERLDALSEADVRRGFDLAAPPLVRLTLVRTGDAEHRVLITFHHLLLDGWSAATVFGEAQALYDGLLAGEAVVLPEPRPFRDYVAWLLRRDPAAAEAFWREEMHGVSPRPLGIGRGPGTDARTAFGERWDVLAAGEVEALQALARQAGVTLNTVFQGALAALLSRYAGSDDVVFGTVSSGRDGDLAGAAEIVGMTINTLPSRLRTPRGARVAAWLREVQARQTAAREHDHAPLVEVQRWSGVPAGRPLFEVLYAFENYPVAGGRRGAEDDGDDGGASDARMVERTGYPLTVTVVPGAETVLRLSWDAARLSDGEAARMAAHLRTLAAAMARDPHALVATLPMLADDERRTIVHAWNRTDRPIPAAPVHRLFEERAAAAPGATALRWDGGEMTYAALDAAAGGLAQRLRARGVGPEARVGVAVERSPELVVALLAVLKAGGAYVPLDAAYPAERLSFMLDDADISILLVNGAVPPALAAFAGTVVSIAADEAVDSVPLPEVDPACAAYVLYTSGSTGRPKGVTVTHRSVVRLALTGGFAELGPEETLLHVVPTAFDVSTFEIWGALLNSATLAVPAAGVPAPDELGAFIRRHRVTTAWLTSGLFHQVVDAGPEHLRGLRQLLVGGDVVSPAHAARVLRELPRLRLIDGYGPTEATTFTTCHDVTLADAESGAIPIGRPIGNTRVYILDAEMRPCPVGVAGELFVGGAALARGYLNRPALTAERFVPDAVSGLPGERLYRTGDLARWRGESGVLDFIGRLDGQVKVRGMRVETGEVEAALAAHPAVRDAAVAVREDGHGGNRLVAWIVPAGGAIADPAELRAHLAGILPEFMLPSRFATVETLPLNANGKVDRRALPDPETAPSPAHRPPETPTERALAAIWSEVLRAERVGAGDDFFLSGGHSLLATQVVSRVRRELGVDLPIRTLFDHPVLEDAAAQIDALMAANEGAEGVDAGPEAQPSAEGQGGDAPLSFQQERLWFIDQLDPGTPAYNIASPLRLLGALDRPALERALAELVRRQAVLRTRFALAGGRPVQRVEPAEAFAPAFTDLSPLPSGEREAELERLVNAWGWTPFDLERGPLFRAHLARLGAEEHALLLAMHHTVADGWSVRILWTELAALYAASAQGTTAPLAPLALTYAEYARRQRGQVAGAALDAQLAWWRERLAGAPALLELPTDRPRPARQSHRGATHAFHLPAETVESARALARQERATPFMVTLAAWAAVLARWSGQDDVVVGTPVAGRTRTDTEALVGLFAHALPLRVRVGGAPTFRALLARVREAELGAYAHQEVPFERVVEALRPARSLGHAPVFQVLFQLADSFAFETGIFPGIVLREMDTRVPVTHVDLSLEARDDDAGGMRGALEYATDLFDAATATRLAAHFAQLLRSAVERPDAPLAALEMMDGAERARVLALGRAEPRHPDAPVHRIVEAWAARAPGATALRWDGGAMTYGELNARANRIARRLQRIGVPPEGRVAVAMERSPELVVTLLAVLKAGAAYVPIDPAYPAARLELMLRDSGASTLAVADRLPPALGAASLPVLSLARDAGAIAEEDGSDLPEAEAGGSGESAAYVLYTSGSTGTPKGVAVPHRAIVRLAVGADYARFAADEVFLHLAPPAFDASTFEVWGALLNGASIAVHPAAVPEPAALGAFIRRHGVTTAWLTAGLFHRVVDADPAHLRGLRQLLAGGDVLSAPRVLRLMDALPELRLIDGYGPTEGTTFSTCHTVRREDAARGVIPIGTPVSGTSVYVLDAALRPVPFGVPGELFVAADGVARGYVARPAATAERFLPDPFGPRPGARMYRTGDRVRWTEGADGTPVLHFLGRMDRQAKVRGFRVEPGEVEAALLAHPEVRSAAVLADGDRLVAYVVARAAAAGAEALRAHLAATLPAYLVPSAFVTVDALPLTANGKVDRAALPAADAAAAPAYLAPRTDTEQALALLWAEVLERGRAGAGDDFFLSGGHSLLATQLAARIRERFAVELPLAAVFEAPVLSALAARIDALAAKEDESVDAPAAAHPERAPLHLPPLPEGADAPLSFAQERLWFIDRLEPGNPVYNIPQPMRLRGALDVGAFLDALRELVRRHAALRTRFALVDGRPVQRADAPDAFHAHVEDLSALAEDERDATLGRLSDEWSWAPFDLEHGPLFRARLVRLATDDHALLAAVHHAVADGWSMGIFRHELLALYDAFRQGLPSPLPALPVTYAGFAAWQRAWLDGDELERQLAYWRHALAGAPTLLELPLDRPRPARQSHRGAVHAFAIPAPLADAVRALAQGERATLFMALLAAWNVLMARWSGADDVVIGTPVAGRTHRDIEGVIGLFVNTLPLRGDLSGDPPFRVLLEQVRGTALAAFAHQDVPFEKLVEELHPERSLAHAPVFQVICHLLNTPEKAFDGPFRVEAMEVRHAAARVDLSLGMVEQDDGSIWAAMEYASDLFDALSMERLGGAFVTLLEAAAAAPDIRVSALPLLSPGERAAAVSIGAATAEFPVGDTLHARFAAQASRTPAAPALTFGGEWISYAELDARVNRLANHLGEMGIGPGARVGLCVERSAETVIGILAILKAGGAYLPLDPAYPDERLAWMLDDSGAGAAITTAELAPRVARPGVRVVRLDADAEAIAAAPGTPPAAAADPDGVAYVIYTSGSTGTPKGVEVTHANVLRLFAAAEGWFGFGAGDVWTLFHSYAFDFSVWEIWGALLHGGRIVVVPFFVSRAPDAFLRLLAEERVTVLSQTPGAFRQLIRADEAAGTPPLALRAVVFGGEALDPATLRSWAERRGTDAPRLVNMYGITETTVHVTARVITAADVAAGGASPIGVPLPDLAVHVLDPRGEPVPVGVPGEMHVGGAGVARGYLGRPALTAQRFVPDPFSGVPGARLYRSGDRARWRQGAESAAPELEYLGRADEQVKVRGFRIEPGEIESVLRAHPAVREAVVLPRGEGDGKRLVAWVVRAGGATEGDVSALREHAASRLPDYMVPAAFVLLGALPLTRNGKVDRAALPEPVAEGSAGGYVAPRTPTEEVLAAIWGGLLDVERVGAEDGFFALGGHSLLATRMVSRVRESFGVELPLRATFERPTLAALAAEIDRLLRAGAGLDAPPIVALEREGDAPLSFAQERMWFVDRLEAGSSAYHMPFAFRIRGTLDVRALRGALDALVARHESLRTAFPLVDGVPVQRIHPPAPADFAAHDDGDADTLLRDSAGRPFDLERGPLFRAVLVRVGEDEHRLGLTLHHLVADGWSIGVIARELAAAYGALAAGNEPGLPPLPLQYADFAAWQRSWLTGEVLETQLAYWRRKLSGAPPRLELPTDFPRPAVQRHHGALAEASIEGGDAAAILSLARREGSTLFMTLLAAWSVVLARWAGQDEVVVGTPVAGRTRAETEPLVGLFLNSLALRTELGGNPGFRELLRRVRETTLEAYAHQDVPFERVLEELRPARTLAHAPVFQAMLNLANFGDAALDLPGLEVQAERTGAELASKFDLTLYASEWNGAIGFALVYDAALFAPVRMREMLAQLAAVLRQAAADPERPVAALSLVSPLAREALPDPAHPLPAGEWRGPVHQAFAARAAAEPDAVAISDAREAWSYGELEKAANRIARALGESGVGRGDVVAVWAHRSAALVRALLATWKAGAAFLVLDPAYPPARLAAYVRAAAPRAFLRVAAAGAVPDAVADALDDTVRRAITLGEKAERDGLFGVPAQPPEIEVAPEDLAYVAFTSGTTGEPKAIAGTHRPLAHFFGWYEREMGIGGGDRVSLLSGLAHDPLLRDVFAPLAAGAAIAIPAAETIGEPGALASWMRAEGVTIAHLTPATAALLSSGDGDARLPALRLALVGGDLLRANDVSRLRAVAPDARLANVYGATETPQVMGVFELPVSPEAVPAVVPLGRGIDGVQLLVLDPAGAPAGVGEVGEIAVRTPYLSLGYLNDAALTAARFVPDPHPADGPDGATGRIYRTGDLGRYRTDGVVEIAGRADRQVKVRGFRIEPGEVEATLRAHPAVRDAAVLARGEGETRRLVAWIVPASADADVDALRAHLAARLPEWMVPGAFVTVPALPLTPNGKLDRAALPDPAPAAEFVPPRTATERALAAIWSELLDVEHPGAADHFFQLGGHSLLATRLAARVRSTLGLELPLRTVFEHPTLAALAEHVDDARAPREGVEADASAAPDADEGGPETIHPVSSAQRRLWLLDQLEPGSSAYNLGNGLRLRGRLDVAALERAVSEVVHRHETLRTRIELRGDEPVQVVSPPRALRLPISDRPGADGAEIAALLADEAARPMELARGALFRALLVRSGAEDHTLLWAVHHIVADGWSTGVLVGELAALYEAFAAGRPSPLAPLPLQYGQHAERERERLSGEGPDREVRWWRNALDGAPALLELPSDRPRPAVQSYRGASFQFSLPAGLGPRIESAARGQGATPFMLVLAAFQAVLARWSGQADLVVGTPIAGRQTVDVEPLIGFFANTLALRGDLSGDPTFRALLARTREAAFGAFEHQALPFERLVEELSPARSLGHAPVFQVMLAWQNAPLGRGAFPGLQAELVGRDTRFAKFDLSLSLYPHADGVEGVAEFATDLFGRATVERLTRHFVTLLEAALANPEARVSALPLMRPEERAGVLRLSAGPAVDRDPSLTLHGLFAAQAARTPGATAVTFADDALTYAELNARADRVAHLLRSRGVGMETPVAVAMERSLEMVIALYGVLKAGAFYVPIEPEHPAERIAWMLEDCGARVVLTQERWRDVLPASVDAVALDAPGVLDAFPPSPLEARPDPDALAYVIYTSGSTGRPKGAGNAHRAVVNRVLWMQETFGLDAGDVVLQKTPFGFDVSVWEFFWPLLFGARLAVAAPGAHREPSRLSEAIRGEGVTTAHFVPSMLQLWLADPSAAACASLRRVMSSGEALPADLRDRFFATLPGVELHNLYGPTEAAVDVTWQPLAPGDREPFVPIGRPIANTRIHVLDPAGGLAPTGVPGELHIAGVQVGRGYRGRPALTAERFVPDSFSRTPGARMYRTGDRARWREGGALEYLGRTDFQVKLRGLRIEPGEIEAALTAEPAVREAVVSVRPGPTGDPRLVAWVVAAEGRRIAPDALRDALGRRLPQHMVPAAFVVMEALPLTPSGKVDRKALPDPDAEEAGFVAPRTPVEEVLAGIWSEVLHRDRIGAGDDFFALGGHSLLATLVVSRVRDRLKVELPLRAVFESPRLGAMAAAVEARMREGAASGAPPIVHVEGNDLPLSFAQERMWFLDRLDPGTAAYNLTHALRLAGALDVAALERALAELVRRHEPLRTVFRGGGAGERPVQHVLDPGPFHLPVVDLAAEVDPLAAARARAAEFAARRFDLERGPVFRAELLRLRDGEKDAAGDAEHALLISLHHVAGDGWSNGIFFGELATLYAAYAEGRESPLPELPVRYADYAAWQREWLDGAVLERQLAWWRDQLAGAPAVLELPADRPRPALQSFRGARVPIELSPEESDALHAFARAEGATVFMVLLAAFQAVLARWSGQDDVVVGTPVAGRTRHETERLVGLFVNTLALRGDLSGDPGFHALLGRVREATLGAYVHQELPFERLVEAIQPERSLGHAPVFQVMCTLQNAPGSGVAFPGLEITPLGLEEEVAKFDLTLALGPHPDGWLRGGLEYAVDLFDAATAERMAAHLRTLLFAALNAPHTPITALPLVDEAERAAILRLSAGPSPAPLSARSVVDHLASRTAAAPDTVAAEFGDDALTYAELAARADRLAQLLRSRGAGCDTGVALLLERSLESVVAWAGVLRAGAFAVPIDPEHPAERIAWMLEDSGARIVLTQERLLDRVPPGIEAIALDAPGALDGTDAPPEAVVIAPESLAYVVYTSGSTGRPKAAAITHANLAAYVAGMHAAYGIAAADRVLHRTPASFDPSVSEIWIALVAGATLVGAPPAAHADPAALVREIVRGRVTVADLVPSLLAAMLDQPEMSGAAPLRLLFCGGEALPETVARRALKALPGAVLVNAYGPAEATITATALEVAPEGRVTIGRPLAGVRAYVLDRRGEPAPIGVPGELCVGGTLVGRGYRGRPALTAERFVPDPFSPLAGARMYRTGDRARWQGGEIEFLGRLDFQVKIRGQRIEPGEVEAALLANPAVREAVVAVRNGPGGEPRLVAWLVPAGEPVAVDALRASLARRLPRHLVPAAWAVVDALPRTPGGKVDRRALPEPEASAAEHAAPETRAERAIAQIWGEVLRRDRIGAGDDFFALGGHSLIATQVVSRIRERLGVEVPLRAVFEFPVLRDLAAHADAASAADPGTPPLVHVEGNDLPLSFAQERMWFIDRLEPGGSAYNMSAAIRLAGALDVAALERALAEVVRRHEPLRTTFPDRDGRAVQHVGDGHDLRLAVEEVAADDGSVSRLVSEIAARPYDLAAGPLFRAHLLRVARPERDAGATEHVLVLAMHHAVSDGWSISILFRELAALYAAFAAGRPSPLAGLALRYADHAVWQRAWLSGDGLADQVRWWRERLSGAPALLQLPTDRPRPQVQSFRGARHRFALGAELAAAAEALARSEGATPFMVLLAAFQALLSRWSGQNDLVVGTPVAGRTRPEVEPLVGLFVNTLALRGDLSGDPAFRALVGRVREATLGAFAHQEVPFEKLVEEIHPARSLGHSPVFQVMFAYQNVPEEAWELPGLSVAGVPHEGATAQTDLALSLTPAGEGGLWGTLEYATDLFDAATAERLAAQLATLLAAAVRAPATPVSALPLLDAGERETLLSIAAGPALPAGLIATDVVAAFTARAAERPGAAAVDVAGRTLSYGVLDRLSNRLARLLRSRGVGPETPVALFLERSAETAIAWLGVLKAGGFVVPVDPDYPAERVARMLEDSGARLALAQERTADRLPAGIDALALDDAGLLAGFPASPMEVAIEPASLAYAIYTSGSTGRPKAAAITRANLAASMAAAAAAHPLGSDDRVLHRTPASFDPSVSEIWLALVSGATLLMAAPGAHADPGLLAAELVERGATMTILVPSLLAAMLDEPALAAARAMRLLICGGEVLPPPVARRFREILPHTAITNEYGPAEATIAVTVRLLDGDAPVDLGAPVAGTRTYVLDARGEPSPIGVPGELVIGGAQVGRGYRGRPALTAERFVPDPFAPEPGARMYRTGDRARWRESGGAYSMEYAGRTDFQVKLRGQRIEPGEVEAALLAEPGVRQAVVAVRPGATGDPRLVAWVVVEDGAEATDDALRAALASRLPRHLVPASVVCMDALPRAPGGKVDRGALPDPARAEGGGYVEPYTPTEIEMADLWSEVLAVEKVGAEDDFFALGGHSLLAVRLMARIRQRFGRELALAELFRSPTLSRLAAAVDAAGEGGPAPALVALHAAGTRPPLFFVHPAGGTVFRYAELARALGPDQPFYGIQARGIGDDLPPLDRMEEMVEHYAAAIRAAFPTGPYLVGGWSAGGPIAFALAARLRETGADAPLAIVLDALAPGDAEATEFDDVALYLHFARDLAAAEEPAVAELEAQLRALPAAERTDALGRWLASGGAAVPAAMATQIGRTVRVWEALDRALKGWRAPVFGGGLLLLESELGSPSGPRPEGGLAPGWAPHVGGRLEWCVVPGAHATFVLEPWVHEVAKEIRAAVDAVIGRGGPHAAGEATDPERLAAEPGA
jgi:amino acid adenylation domain-containing protein